MSEWYVTVVKCRSGQRSALEMVLLWIDWFSTVWSRIG